MKRQQITVTLILVALAFLLVGERAAAVDYTTAVPLPDLCGDTYYGQAGCLYPGSNQPPTVTPTCFYNHCYFAPLAEVGD